MRKFALVLGTTLLLATSAIAQKSDNPERNPDEGRRRRGPSDRRPAPNLMFEAIDTDGDQVITPRELRKDLVALKQLDYNNDGNITLAEVTPERPPGGPGGDGPRDPAEFIARIMESDANGDGKLQPSEVSERMMPMMEGGDMNGDGAIDAEELAQVLENRRGGGDPQQMVKQLMANDENGDGMLSPDEVPERDMRMLRGADLNEDGYLNAKEVARAVEQMAQRGGRRGGPGEGGPQDGERRRGGEGRPQRPPAE
jgi:Ca2+-binding EF-hand superfamily protein